MPSCSRPKDKLRQRQDATIQLDQWYATAQENIKNADNETKRITFEILDIKVYAAREEVQEIKGIIDADLLPLHKHRHHCFAVGIAILKDAAM